MANKRISREAAQADFRQAHIERAAVASVIDQAGVDAFKQLASTLLTNMETKEPPTEEDKRDAFIGRLLLMGAKAS